MTPTMIEALRLAASRQSGLISGGHSFPTSRTTLRALAKRGYLVHIATVGTYYDMRAQYRITAAGRDAAAPSSGKDGSDG